MKTILVFGLFLMALPLFSQIDSPQPPPTERVKGATPLTQNSTPKTQNSIRAVIVGISDYQDNGIPDLHFADRDAEAFAAWLRSPAGGSVPERNLVLLTNERATLGKIVGALTGLIADVREGEQVIIYFSGHGDVEANLFSQPGYLLCHDSKAAVYMAGAFNIRDLQEVVNTLSLKNKARVLLITDACRAGKLAGNNINGAQLTNSNLANQFENATKVLSCEPNEFSLEGAQWGGGRGLFSYHLVDGLTGMADANADGAVVAREIQRYLQDKVTAEAQPATQNPMVVGSAAERLATVDAPALAALLQERSGQGAQMQGTDMRGWEDDLVAATDSATQALYYAYKGALEHGALIDTADGFASAWGLLPQLLQRESLRELHGLLKRNLAAVLQDEAQQALNALLNDDPYEANQWQYNPDKYSRYPEYLAKSIELLGESHYMYSTLMAKKFFFEAKSAGMEQHSVMDNAIFLDSLNRKIRNLLHRGLQFDPQAAYLCYYLENSFYASGIAEADSFFYYHDRALALSPTWMLPRRDAMNSYLFNHIQPNWQEVEKYALAALSVRPESYIMLEKLAWLYQRMFKLEQAIQVCLRMIELRPDLPNGYNTIGTTCIVSRKYDLSKSWSLKALEVDSSTLDWTVYNLAAVFIRTRAYDNLFRLTNCYPNPKDRVVQLIWFFRDALRQVGAFDVFMKMRDYLNEKYPMDDPGDIAMNLVNFGNYQLQKEQIKQAEAAFHQAFKADSGIAGHFIDAYSGLAQVAAQKSSADSAEFYFQKAINYHFDLLGSWEGRAAFTEARYHYARFLLTQNRPADAKAQLLKAEEIDPRNPLNYYGMAALHAAQKHDAEALDWLAKALEWYYPDYDEIMAEPLFQKNRETKRFKTLMKKHFPAGSEKAKVEALARKYMPELFGN